MAKLFNRAKMTTSTTGSGTVTLGNASVGYQSFADAGVSNGDVVQYVIEEGGNFEIGTGTYSATGTSLTRSPTESSNSGAAISLSGAAIVSITAVADDLNRLQHEGSTKVEPSATGATVTGNLAVTGTVDGRDVATDGTKLDAIDQGLATTDSPSFSSITIDGHTLQDSTNRSGLLEVSSSLGTWKGFSIASTGTSHWSIMGDQDDFGLYDDVNNEWILQYNENSTLQLFSNGTNSVSVIETGLNLPSAKYITFEGATSDSFETFLTVADPTADRTITLPDESGTVLTTASYDTNVVHLKSNVNSSVTEGSANEFTVNFNLEEHNDTGRFSHSSGVVTVSTAGWYQIRANLVYQNASASVRNTIRAYVKKNGTEVTSTRTYDYDRGTLYGEFSNNKIDTMLYLAANDTIEIANYGVNIDGSVTIQSEECEFIINSVSVETTSTNADTVDSLHASQFLRSDTADTASGIITFAANQTFDGRDVSADGAKLDGIESGATADQTAAEIRTLVENATDSNVFTDADHTKLNGIESGATADQTASEILTAIKTVDGTGSGLDADTVDGIQASSFVRSDASDTLTGGTYTLSSSTDEKIILSGSTNPYIRWQEGTTDRAYIQYNATNNALTFKNQEADYFDFFSHDSTGAINLRLKGSDGDTWGSLYADDNGDAAGRIGFLDDDQSWAYRITSDATHEWLINGTAEMSLSTTTLDLKDNTITNVEDIYLNDRIYHDGDTDTYMQFHAANQWRVVCAGAEQIEVGNGYVLLNDNKELRFGTGSDFRIDFNGSNTVFRNYAHANGNFYFQGEGSDGNNRNALRCDFSGANAYVALYDNSAEVLTTNGGVAVTGGFTATGDVTAYYSDSRLKTKTGDIENALDKVKQLNGFYYVENDKAKEFGFENDKTQVALSAQEVQAVMPEAVSLAPFDLEKLEDGTVKSKSGEDYLTVNYARLVPLLVEAMKEQQQQIDDLKAMLGDK